ncbi:uncharacterized protein [Coffea arabica]|uniref:Uncharacterized protein n=1 Tax=Coffea arabica TaxID=13443 RepID=A0ABM4X5L8_COFAR
MYHFLASVVARLEPCFARRDWVLICSTGLASFLCKKADIDFEQYENRQTKDKADIDSHINMLFEKRFEPRIHPTEEEVVKTQGLRDLFKDLVTNAEICEDGLSKDGYIYGDEVIRQAEVGVTRGVATRRSQRPSPIPSQ